jgi:hypothetical protein
MILLHIKLCAPSASMLDASNSYTSFFMVNTTEFPIVTSNDSAPCYCLRSLVLRISCQSSGILLILHLYVPCACALGLDKGTFGVRCSTISFVNGPL